MALELKIDVTTGTTADHRQGRIIVRGHIRNLGDRPRRLSISHIGYKLRGPRGPIEIRNEAVFNVWDETEIPADTTKEFESELVAYAPPAIEPGCIYSLTGQLPEGGDSDVAMLKFRQLYLSPINVVPAGSAG